jgi:NAD(P)-dependent dehydrogenase (short-subunit alcohol dehydrogenase family)
MMSMYHPRTAVVTGAGSGIGRAIAVALAGKGYKVGIVDVDTDGAGETLRMVERKGGSGETYKCDVSDFSEVQAMAEHFFDNWGEVGLLVNNAGIGGGGYVGETSIEDWEKVVGVDFWGVVYGCHAFIPRMKTQAGGHIVNTSSTSGLVPVMGFAPYNTSKAAVVALSETLLIELAPFNIGVTVLCPSIVKTNIMKNSLEVIDAGKYESLDWGIELIDIGMERSKISVEDVARMVLDAVEKGRLFVVTNRPSRSNWRNYRISPERYYRAMAYLNRKGLARRFMMWAVDRGMA